MVAFDFDEVMLLDRVIRRHPTLWKHMPAALTRIEIESAREDAGWAQVRHALVDVEAPMQYRPPLRVGESDTITFVFENGTQASVPDRYLAHEDFGDVIPPAFTAYAGDPLEHNPYTTEMPIGDLWSVLTANAALLYSGGEPLPFRNGRIVLTRPGKTGPEVAEAG
jgi:hypothetical protein